jgi:DNA-binding MarR family transcriptional regulator
VNAAASADPGPDPSPVEASPPSGNGNTARLREFLGEVNALAVAIKRAEARMRPAGELSAGGRVLLEVLAGNGERTVPQLARIRSTSRQNIQVLVNRLLRDGYVEVRTNPAHKRSDLVHLTPKGEALLAQGPPQDEDLLGTLSARLSESDLTDGIRLLHAVRGLLFQADLPLSIIRK